jgi:hypothetical protein
MLLYSDLKIIYTRKQGESIPNLDSILLGVQLLFCRPSEYNSEMLKKLRMETWT